eukprot:2546505-Pleurochrysis_carterae.AAC.1
MLNVAALSAAIAIGAMQFIDAGASYSLATVSLFCAASCRVMHSARPSRTAPIRTDRRHSQAKRA